MSKKIKKYWYICLVSILIIIIMFYYISSQILDNEYNRVQNEYCKSIFNTYQQYIYPEIKAITLENILALDEHTTGNILGRELDIRPIYNPHAGGAFDNLIYVSYDAGYLSYLINAMNATYLTILKPEMVIDPFFADKQETKDVFMMLEKENTRTLLNELIFNEAKEMNELIIDKISTEIIQGKSYRQAFQAANIYFEENDYLDPGSENRTRIRRILYEFKE